MDVEVTVTSREQLLHALYGAAELEHNLMCTDLYAAFNLRDGAAEGLSPAEADAVSHWRREILQVAVDEMGHLSAVWNITSALGGSPRLGRGNFPLDPGGLPASVVVRLAPFNESVLQHFIFLERPDGSTEADGEGYAPKFVFKRGLRKARLTPMGVDYETVGAFYATLGENLREFVTRLGERRAFSGDPALQMSTAEVTLGGANPVLCLKTALAAFAAIVQQGEGAPMDARPARISRGSWRSVRNWRRSSGSIRRLNPRFLPPSIPSSVHRCVPPAASGSRMTQRPRQSMSPTPSTGS